VQIHNLVKSLDQLSDDELLERLRQVRHNREVARPVAKRKAATAAKKETVARTKKMSKLLDGLSDDDRAKLIEQLSEGESDE